METRLDRLFTLLDTGSTLAIRKSAANQLGDIVRLHPQKLRYLLNKILVLMRSRTWETRLAAGNAIESLAKNVSFSQEFLKDEATRDMPTNASLTKFDIMAVLKDGASLLSAEEEQFDIGSIGLDDKEKILRQKLLLNKKLGLEGPVAEGLELFDDEDLKPAESSSMTPIKTVSVQQMKEIVDSQLNVEGMSVREISVAKRKARLDLKRQASGGGGIAPSSSTKKLKTMNVAVEQPGQTEKILLDTVAEEAVEEDTSWPFLEFSEILCNELFSPVWEVRHGAATLIRGLVNQCGYSAGVVSLEQADEQNQDWLETLAVRLVCILALDRFGDYISDEIVAPVRETCAQTLGTVCKYLPKHSVLTIVRKLAEIIHHPTWEVRYGVMLGLKYIIAVKQELAGELETIMPALLELIDDSVDDVRAVTATSLLPIIDRLQQIIPEKVEGLINSLWDALLDLDDLTSSTHSMMALLSALLTVESALSAHVCYFFLLYCSGKVLLGRIPRVWPFLSHNINSVRRASLKMLNSIFTESANLDWIQPVLVDCLRHIYQRCVTEPNAQTAELASQAWCSLVNHTSAEVLCEYAVPWLHTWICLLMQPGHLPIDGNFLLWAKHHSGESRTDDTGAELLYVSGPDQDKPDVRSEKVMYSRLICSRCLGRLLARIPLHLAEQKMTKEEVCKILDMYLAGRAAVQRLCSALVITHWVQYAQEVEQTLVLESTQHLLLRGAEENLYYDEVASLFTRLQTECKDFIASLKLEKVSMDDLYPSGSVFTIESAQQLATVSFEQAKETLRKSVHTKFSEYASGVLFTVNQLRQEFSSLNMRVQLCLATALVSLKCFPPKLNPVIRPLMETIKKESFYFFQNLASEKLCCVLTLCSDRATSPNRKVFKNLCTALCAYTKYTPQVFSIKLEAGDSTQLTCDSKDGILSLFADPKSMESRTGAKRGPKPKKVDITDNDNSSSDTAVSGVSLSAENIQYEGSRNALWSIVSNLSQNLLTIIPSCVDHFLTPFQQELADSEPQAIVNALHVLRVVFDALPLTVKSEVLTCFHSLIICIKSEHTAIRHMAARTIASTASSLTDDVMNRVLEEVLPLLGAAHDVTWRQGAIETIYHIVEVLSVQCLPYLVLMVVPVLGRMTDQNLSIQMLASQCFASLIKLMPLEGGVSDPPNMKECLVKKKAQERQFLDQLLNGRILQNYGIPVPIKADLRKYQQDGVNWLAFLNKYKLHGILCDDMGLGKTLQTICIVSGDHHMRQQKYNETQEADSLPLPSLVVCPSTLCGHWVYEVEKFVDSKHLKALNYSALPAERIKLREVMKDYSLVVASYEIVRNDIDFLRTLTWNYCILDEGHIIKNPKSKTTLAVKRLNCNHRLILTGTPVQNNTLELWSLFDFLMPGYLGTERQFSSRYSRPILQSRDARSSSKEQEAGALAVESLHKQVLPFLLRRLKSDVLQDLPPKIIQDYYCELSPLQAQLYREFGQSSAGTTVQKSLTSMNDDSNEQTGMKGHIFQALQYLKKVCNHPALVLHNSKHPQHEKMMAECKLKGRSITDIEYSAKLTALKQLLLDCGIGVTRTDSMDNVVSQHRALIFCQWKLMIDIIESELLEKCLPSVTYLRLDGSTAANNRQSVVHRFNDDPSIDLLLLTTTVGGLGLNLTGADTVIFVEHDWNPMKDLQAMDRAHRIGQTKVVNVYRLITRHTLEEKIMGLQKFKLNIANTIVNQDNSSLTTMATDQLLDLFSLENGKEKQASGTSPSKGLKSMLQGMTELWDESEYDTEYDVTNFLASLSKR
ncbi:TATA-binding protein-associated factor 172-like [Watersipora subatra]|uniref:TATA-binding protein-associated factor 172-like n=1 Tax=Watersipora subatra TaxID=2589382 RepID=UPI00355BB668